MSKDWIDTHCHIDKLTGEPKEILETALKAGVFRVLTIGTEWEDWPKVLSLSEEHAPYVYGALGMHPHSSKDFNSNCEDFLRENLTKKRIAALGEIGLDYYYEHSPKNKQQEIFEKQLCLAEELNLPVEIHTRSAEKDSAFFLKKYQSKVKGLLHCFTGSYHLAKTALDCGFNISFSGIITFKKSEELRQTCQKIPLDRLHIETDAPFLSPEPHRGKENQPSYTYLTAECVAKLHQVELEHLSNQLKKNTWDLFPKIKKEEDLWKI